MIHIHQPNQLHLPLSVWAYYQGLATILFMERQPPILYQKVAALGRTLEPKQYWDKPTPAEIAWQRHKKLDMSHPDRQKYARETHVLAMPSKLDLTTITR